MKTYDWQENANINNKNDDIKSKIKEEKIEHKIHISIKLISRCIK